MKATSQHLFLVLINLTWTEYHGGVGEASKLMGTLLGYWFWFPNFYSKSLYYKPDYSSVRGTKVTIQRWK